MAPETFAKKLTKIARSCQKPLPRAMACSSTSKYFNPVDILRLYLIFLKVLKSSLIKTSRVPFFHRTKTVAINTQLSKPLVFYRLPWRQFIFFFEVFFCVGRRGYLGTETIRSAYNSEDLSSNFQLVWMQISGSRGKETRTGCIFLFFQGDPIIMRLLWRRKK